MLVMPGSLLTPFDAGSVGILYAMLFLWQFPHFMEIAWM